MTALLTDNLPLLAGAPNGIKKLRELILELAIRGKLLPQDPNDEPAIELLQPIVEEKARLVREGKLKKQKPSANIGTVEKPFDFPKGWLTAYLADIVAIVTDGDHQPPPKAVEGVPFLVIGNLNTGNIRFEGCRRVPHDYFDALDWGRKPCQGDILYTVTGSFGIPIVVDVDEPFCVQRHVAIIKTTKHLPSEYLRVLLASPYAKNYAALIATGIAQKTVPLTGLRQLIVPLPPLAEQHRIVAKVDELMHLCDRLEAQQTDAGNAHAQLVQALLDSLTQASDATDFATNWQRLAEHFHTLFKTEPSIDALKQTLLQLAVMGKLVSQDPSDESATAFVKRIQAGKQRYLAESNTRKQKDMASDSLPEPPFEVPVCWKWQTIDDVLHVTGGVTLGRKLGDRKLLSKPYLRVANVQRGRLEMEQIKEVEVPEDEVEKYLLRNGDLLITEGGDWDKVGRTAIWRDELPECLHQNHIFRARAVVADWEPRWAEMYLNSASARKYFAGSSKQTTNLASINMTQLRSCAFPLPPLGEQQRIVAKVDQLMVLCDQLKTRLTQAHQLNELLASTLVERSLAEDAQQGPIATDLQVARTLLAAEITHQLHSHRTFGQRKLQKVIYLAEHTARLAAIQGNYLRDAAGPHDRQLMNKVEGEMQDHRWYERIEREIVGHAYRPLSQAGQHRQAYCSAWPVAERATIEQVIELMRDWDTDRCEMTVTLYAAWNDFILEGRPVSDDAIVDEVMHSWNDTKLRFGKTEWLAVLAEMKKHKILMPTGFGKRTKGGMLSLPGFE
ncbi:restriction endonuclease subunit S [Pseudomonas syringae]|uniref:restriction endonuclease subunit S n=1 Tax=Pseudomonas syringae TaxID=317 RepID=UPI0018E5ACB1|nr:restriction endonuclease subunit S [Pseudomonas syringae]MBI6743560.1 restriction endonuclease subunit S [Pseudomonas syringae]MBI6746748.1 restriction endonuclease subunit S [Pseudomonas syringae]MBI6763468.1 restriction endonuclease subunit S [Pseudomonas syringae]MBI6765259.1 restriction endonuclease subunit S [Pseudomonas syringae]MBI6785868.1 restriction endonuclease subunit S [Pseudomonas syringae]